MSVTEAEPGAVFDAAEFGRVLGIRLRAVRESLGLSVARAAARFPGKMSAAALSQYERGARCVTAEKLTAIARFYGVPVLALIPPARLRPVLKAEIRGIGQCWPHDPDEHGRTWTAQNWAMEGGDFPAADLTTGKLGGWTLTELALISDLAIVSGQGEALARANAYRRVPDAEPASVIEVRL